MSSLQLLLDLADSLDSLSLPYYSDFGLGLSPYQILSPQNPKLVNLPLALASRLEPLERHLKESRKVSNIGKDGFQVCMDVQQFKPSELSVKVVDNVVVVEGKHEERQDNHGLISRHFVRRYAIPKDYDADKLVSTLSSDGVLTLRIPKPALEEKPYEKVIQIQQTGPAHLNVKENAAEDESKDSGAKKDEVVKK